MQNQRALKESRRGYLTGPEGKDPVTKPPVKNPIYVNAATVNVRPARDRIRIGAPPTSYFYARYDESTGQVINGAGTMPSLGSGYPPSTTHAPANNAAASPSILSLMPTLIVPPIAAAAAPPVPPNTSCADQISEFFSRLCRC